MKPLENTSNNLFDTFVGENTKIKGSIEFDTSISINGTFEGEIKSDKGTIVINEKAKISSNIKTSKVIIRGSFKGDIEATEKIEAFKPAIIEGNIKSPIIKMGEGVIFRGECVMDKTARRGVSKKINIALPEQDNRVLDKKNKKTLLKSLTNIFSNDS